MELQDKIAVVTGAGRGMGRAISLQLADAGANVAVADINAENVEETSVAVKWSIFNSHQTRTALSYGALSYGDRIPGLYPVT